MRIEEKRAGNGTTEFCDKKSLYLVSSIFLVKNPSGLLRVRSFQSEIARLQPEQMAGLQLKGRGCEGICSGRNGVLQVEEGACV